MFAAGNSTLVTAQPGTSQDLAYCWHLGQTGRADEAAILARDIRDLADMHGDKERASLAALQISWYSFQLGQTEEGLKQAQRAAHHFAECGDQKHEAQARALLAWHMLEIGLMDEAIDECSMAIALADSSGDLSTRSLAMNVRGVTFWGVRQMERAIAACSEAVELARQADNMSFVCLWLINVGGSHLEAAYIAQDRNDIATFSAHMSQALRHTTEAKRLAARQGDLWAERLCCLNRAETHFVRGDNLAALHDLQSYQTMMVNAFWRDKESYFDLYGRAMNALGRHEEAIEALNEGLAMSSKSGNIEAMQQCSRNLANAYEALGQFDKALTYYKRFHALYLQLSADRAQQKARLAEVLYEVDKLKARAAVEARRADDIAGSYQALQLQAAALAHAAELDPLTGLFNRRRLDSMLGDLDANQPHYCIAMIDIDHFKQINDGFSHMIGDMVLKQIAQILRQHAERDCTTARFGGEEFTFVLPGFVADEAQELCEKIRHAVESWHWPQIAPSLGVTISIGLADNLQARDARSVLQIADQHLYQAKTNGRNRICMPSVSTAA